MASAKHPDDIVTNEAALHFPAEDQLDHSKSLNEIIRNAKNASEVEHQMSLWQGIKLYPKAVGWSILISTCIAMEGYDISLLSNFCTYEVPAPWQAGLSNVCLPPLTSIATAHNVETLLVAEILCGIPWGIFQTLTITYASEVCPVALRGYLTTYVNFCWGLGQIIGVGVIKSMLGRTDEWAYRETNFNADDTISMMVHTTKLEEKITAGASYLDCFKGTDLRRTEIVCMVWAMQNLSGNSFSGYSTYFLKQAGLSSSRAYDFALGQYGINMGGVFGAWFLMTLGIGRRSLYLYGLMGLCIMLFILGFLGLVPESHRDAGSLATGAIMLVWACCYQLSVGTVCYSLVSELSTRRLQIKTVVLGRNLYNIVGIVCSVLTPYMLNPEAWDWANYAGFFWGGSCFLCVIYTYFRLPEPAGRTFAELDLLFERGVSARKFATTKVDVFEDSVAGSVMEDHAAEKRAENNDHLK
ncbi:putative Maltose permease MAL31 [Glarea lozoyensis 74030]|uniref:Putative Maltose permease MAL31 n=1 Tax=Glarea lozoyensis (strain ATCC 74030 / MF5533) TaxID=1104152 RepID=H0EWW5_GLAL7|nr:putative Maltose permease MAL31 [Glarea lozoyensis 74030]